MSSEGETQQPVTDAVPPPLQDMDFGLHSPGIYEYLHVDVEYMHILYNLLQTDNFPEPNHSARAEMTCQRKPR